jgi:hypothetical protein
MIRLIPDLPANVVGFEAIGDVSADDYTNTVVPAIDQALRTNNKIRLLHVLDEGFDGYSPGAIWMDTKLGIEHLRHLERIAVVTDASWIERTLGTIARMIPGEARAFTMDHRADAQTWVSS